MIRSAALLFFLLSLSLHAGAENYETLFSFDAHKLEAELTQVSRVEKFLEAGAPGEAYALYFKTIGDTADLYVKNKSKRKYPQGASYWTGFFSGCVGCGCGAGFFLGPLSVLGVYLVTDNDKYEVKQATQGCMSGGAVGAVVCTLFYLWYYRLI